MSTNPSSMGWDLSRVRMFLANKTNRWLMEPASYPQKPIFTTETQSHREKQYFGFKSDNPQ
jgi:hypothetical protein